MSNWSIDPNHTQVGFSAKHLGVMTVRGHFTDVQASIDFNEDDFTASSVEATIGAGSVTTGNDQRDGHLKSPDFLEVEKFPTIHFKSTSIERAAHDHYKIGGDLTIRDVTRPVTLDLVYSGQAKTPWGTHSAGFSAEGSISRKEWGLIYNAALETGGWVVSDEIKLTLEVEAMKVADAPASAAA